MHPRYVTNWSGSVKYFRRICVNSGCIIITSMWYLIPTSIFSANLEMIKFTNLEGALEFDYSVEDLEVKRVDGSNTTQRRPVTEQKLELQTQGYVYHPNLLEMELGVGVRFRNEEYETNSGTNESEQKLYSFNGNFDVLKQKPYPLHLYYNQNNPTFSVGLADTFTIENKNYGLIFSILKPLASNPVWLKIDHTEEKGKGRGVLVDSDYDYQQLHVQSDSSDNFTASVSVDHSRKQSGSGSMNLPLQSTFKETYGFDYGSKYFFGEMQRNTLSNTLSYEIVDYKNIGKRKDGRFYASLELDHNDVLDSFYRYNLDSTRYTDSQIESTIHNLMVGVLTDDVNGFTFSGNIDANNEQNYGFKKDKYSVNSTLSYKSDLSENTSLTTTYMLNYSDNWQESETQSISIVGESYQFNDLRPIVLEREFVVPETVVVSNQDRTQIYVEGFDYQLTVVGGETRVERLLYGNISDGESVLIDYAYETGGTFDYSLFRQGLSSGLSFFRAYRLHIGYTKYEERLKSGRPLRELYTRERAYASAAGKHRLTRVMGLSWHLELEKENGKLRPFYRKEADLNYSFALPFFTSYAEWQSRYESIDNKLSNEDLNLTRHGLTLFARTGLRSRIRMGYSVERDTGGTLPRETTRSDLSYEWAWRLLNFSLEGRYSLEEQGDMSRKESSIFLKLIRNI